MTWQWPPTGNSTSSNPAALIRRMRSSLGIRPSLVGYLVNLNAVCKFVEVVNSRQNAVLLTDHVVFREIALTHKRLEQVRDSFREVRPCFGNLFEESLGLRIAMAFRRQRRRGKNHALAEV